VTMGRGRARARLAPPAGATGWSPLQVVLVVIAAALVIGACGEARHGPPGIVIDRTACSHCTMLISEPAFAAARRTADGTAFTYDDLACLRADLQDAGGDRGRIWVRDLHRDVWIDGDRAVFVRSAGFRTPMGGATVAVADSAEAERLAAERQGVVLASFETWLVSAQGGAR
jgi:copper chaperone NosL